MAKAVQQGSTISEAKQWRCLSIADAVSRAVSGGFQLAAESTHESLGTFPLLFRKCRRH